jgi:hypothetical protein
MRKNKVDRDEGRDVSERIALGMLKGTGNGGGIRVQIFIIIKMCVYKCRPICLRSLVIVPVLAVNDHHNFNY